MSFAKSKTKRFNDLISCAPPPGTYDPKELNKVAGAYLIKEKRFKDPLAQGDNGDVSMLSVCSYGSLETLTPRKALFSNNLLDSAKKPGKENVRERKPSAADLSKQREMEAEMKRLVKERNDLDRSLHHKEDELSKLDNRLQLIQKDKTALEANMASLKKELASLRKSNDSLKQNLHDDIRKAVTEAKRPLVEEQQKMKTDVSEKESRLQRITEDLEQSRSALAALTEDNTELKQRMTSDMEKAEAEVRRELQEEQDRLTAEHDTQRAALTTTIQSLEAKLYTLEADKFTLTQNKTTLKAEIDTLKESIVGMNVQKFEDDNLIRHLKGEVFAMTDSTQEKDEVIKEREIAIAGHKMQIQELVQKEQSLTEDIHKLTTKCTELEKNLIAMETEAKAEQQKAQMALLTVEQAAEDGQLECARLTADNTELAASLEAEQETSQDLQSHIRLLEQTQRELSSQIHDVTRQLSEAQTRRDEMDNEIQSINWDKGMLEGHVQEMEERLEQMKLDREHIISDYEGRLKDVQGQIVIMRDCVDNKQTELSEAITIQGGLSQQLQRVQSEFSIEMQKNRTREFLLQEQEKENCRELERAQRSETEVKGRLAATNQQLLHYQASEEDLRQKYQALEASHNHQIHEMRDKLRQSSLTAAECRQQVTLLERRLEEKSEELQVKDLGVQGQEAQIQEREATNHSLAERITELEEMSLRQKTTLKEQETRLKEQEKLLKEQEKLLKEQETLLKEQETQINEQEPCGASKQETSSTNSEDNEWRQKYEILYQKVLPFEEQIEAFEAERCALLGISQNAQHEVQKLSREYAKLLGHQNQKQKIHHILKIKEENNALKMESGKLREATIRQKRQISKLEDQLRAAEGKKRFEATKAFTHTKENQGPPASPLRDGNRR